MLQKTKPSKRISHIIQFLSSRRKVNPPTLQDIVDHLNNHPDSTKEVSLRTIERALNDIREKLGIKVHCESIKGKHVYTLDDSNELPMIDEEDKSDLGILLRLINTHEELQSVQWLKSMLIEDFGMQEDHFKNDELFVLPKPLIKDHDKILKLAMELIRYAKLETVIQFFYQGEKTIENTQLRLVARMQVRYYDGRYYLAGITWRFEKEPYNNLTIYAIDKIDELQVGAAINESEVESDRSLPIKFNRKKLAKKVGLIDYFKHCIGVIKPNDKNPIEIKLRFTGWARSHVINHPIHYSQKIKENKEELIISIFVFETIELDFALAKYKDACSRLD